MEMDLRKLNSATKYPSILTYHEMGDRGRLNPTVQVPFLEGQDILVSEKGEVDDHPQMLVQG